MQLLEGKLSGIEERLGESNEVSMKKLDSLKDQVFYMKSMCCV